MMRLLNFLGRALGVTMFILAGIFTVHAAEAPKSPAAALAAAAVEADAATGAQSFVESDRKIQLAQSKSKYKGKGKKRARRNKDKIGKGAAAAAAAALLLGLAASSASKADESEDEGGYDDGDDDYSRGPSCGQLQYKCNNGSDWACRKHDRSC